MTTPQPASLQGKVAIITGSGQGIGLATAQALSQAGASIVIAELDKKTGQEAADTIHTSTGNPTLYIQTDVTSSSSIQAMVTQTATHYGRLDIAVNNAGIPPDHHPISELDETYWAKIMAINLTGVALSLKHELHQMINQSPGGGVILNMASGTVYRTQKNMAAYTAAKHGVVSLTRTAALENGVHGIRVNALAPGGVSTELTMGYLKVIGKTEEEEASRTSLLSRFAKPEEVGRVVAWLCSDTAAYMTGAIVPLDAGMSAM